MDGARNLASEVLEFWFVQSRSRQRFAKDPAFVALLQQRFQGLTRRAIAGELDTWRADPAGGLALSLKAVERGWLEAALPLFERFSDPHTADFARRHRDVIARFGRFPHRNALLGWVSSAEELAFLQTPGSRF
jgi:uncharacterized protein (DUF924 family)